jgi:cystathionine beta-lyase
MRHNFDLIHDRLQSDSVKWQQIGRDPLPPDVLPMWVADMDFRSPESVMDALKQRVDHGIFGYTAEGSPEVRPAVQRWLRTRYDWTVAAEDLLFLPNLVSALWAAAKAFSDPGDAILTLTPVYPPFLWTGKVAERDLITVDLVSREAEGVLRYEIDFDALERAVTSRTKLFMLCNPHNPVGRVYTRAELERLAEFCVRHDLMLCSDEIHADLLMEGTHIPIASLSSEVAARTLTLNAPSKTFNIAGLGFGYAVGVPEVMTRYRNVADWTIPHPSLLSYTAALAAYTDTSGWLDDLLVYLRGNRDALVEAVRRDMPALKLTRPEGTYLTWIDCRALGLEVRAAKFFLDQAKVGFGDGADFGTGNEGFVRVNFGCPRATLMEALARMSAAITTHQGVQA